MIEKKLTAKQAAAILWHKGIISWKLDSNQMEMYNSYKTLTGKTAVWLCSRRLGKSFALCVIAIETCLKQANSVVKYVAPQTKMVRTIIRPLLREVLKDCPPELKPDYKTQEQLYRFPNGSEIQLAGTDNQNAENIRGGGAQLCIVDEAGFCDDLPYIIKSILLPTTTTTRGKIILSSTPPKSPGHPFAEDYVKEAEVRGTLITKTIYDNPRLTTEDINEIITEYGGIENSDFRREFLCEIEIDSNSAIVPEFNAAKQLEMIKETVRPAYYDCYVSMDIGAKDFTAVLFAYFDFTTNKIVVEDEYIINGPLMTTDVLAKNIIEKESSLWSSFDGIPKKVYMRVADNNNLILLNDLQIHFGLTFLPTAKDNAEAAINHLRVLVKTGRLVINPRCVTLIRHMKNATWNKARNAFARSSSDGHYDALAALVYMCRNVQLSKNPFPSNYGLGTDSYGYNQGEYRGKYSKLQDIFKTKKSISN